MTEAKKTATAIKTNIENNGDLVLTFGNGETLVVHTNRLNEGIRNAALMHGLRQKLVDAAALSRNPDTGRSATIEGKCAAVRGGFDRITAADGAWGEAAVGDGESGNGGLLFRALVRMYPKKTEGQIKSYLETLDKAQQAALRGSDRVKPVIEEIKAEDAAKKTGKKGTGEDLLAGLDGLDDEEDAPM